MPDPTCPACLGTGRTPTGAGLCDEPCNDCDDCDDCGLGESCEGCMSSAVTRDTDGIPLCADCFDALDEAIETGEKPCAAHYDALPIDEDADEEPSDASPASRMTEMWGAEPCECAVCDESIFDRFVDRYVTPKPGVETPDPILVQVYEQLVLAIRWALSDVGTPDPGPWPDGVPLPRGLSEATRDALREPTDRSLLSDPLGGAINRSRRRCAARRILVEVTRAS